MTDVSFYRDGYTKRRRIVGKPGLFCDVTIEFRPTSPIERDRMIHVVKNNHPDVYNGAAYIMLAKHITSWDVHDDQGTVPPITKENMNGLPPTLYDDIYWIVMGDRAGVLPLDASDGEAADWMKQIAGEPPGVEAAKNSTPG